MVLSVRISVREDVAVVPCLFCNKKDSLQKSDLFSFYEMKLFEIILTA